MKPIRFKGGPIFLNSGGIGPDDWLLKPIKGGRWTRVILRFGRHYTGSGQAADGDMAAWRKIHPVQQLGLMYAKYSRNQTRIPTMSASEFWAKYGEGK